MSKKKMSAASERALFARKMRAWQMQGNYPLGFLPHFYYQARSFSRQQDAKHND